MSKYKYGLIRQKEDERDFKLAFRKAQALPRTVDLRSKCPSVFDQGKLGSCTANAGVAARMMLDGTTTELSRLFLYYQERVIEGTQSSDSGAEMRDICAALLNTGVCEERFWPYRSASYAKAPNIRAVSNALNYKIGSYITFDGDADPDDVMQIRQYLFERQQPVMIGIDVYDSFESDGVAKTGIVPMPDTAKEQLLGGHAVLIVGYDDRNSWFIVRNSWGEKWGDKGYFYLPYNYVRKKLAYDSWVLSL